MAAAAWDGAQSLPWPWARRPWEWVVAEVYHIQSGLAVAVVYAVVAWVVAHLPPMLECTAVQLAAARCTAGHAAATCTVAQGAKVTWACLQMS
jgi:hypothetical protein